MKLGYTACLVVIIILFSVIIRADENKIINKINEKGRGPAKTIEIKGGEFRDALNCAGFESNNDKIEVIIDGGNFYSGVFGLADSKYGEFRGNMEITINGGKFYNKIAAVRNPSAVFRGTFKLNLNGGDFQSVTDIMGTEHIKGGAISALNIGESLDVHAEERGTISFTNPLCDGADPWMFFHDGYYYFTITGGVRLRGYKVTNISDLAHADPVVIWQPQPDREYSRNLWSPEIHYLSKDDVGQAHAGWYLYAACDDGDNANHRMYVLRSLSGNPLGPYGSATTGEKDVPTKIVGRDDQTINNEWSVGVTFLRHKSKLYIMWVGRIGGKHEAEHWQCIYLAELENPWTVKGEKHIICRPTMKWEKYGAGVYGDRRFPEVVEGGTPVYADDGSLRYLVYSGSGYWTSRYALGQMKLVGDNPLDINCWIKGSGPIFSKSKEVNGCGHASFTTSPDGKNRWAIYHAYVGRRSPDNPRRVFAEPYKITAKGVQIAAGSGKPQPLGKKMTIADNPLPINDKISGFSKINR